MSDVGIEKVMVTIPEKEYEQLLRASKWLDALESAGVDNWSGYEYAQEILEGLYDE